MHTTLSSKWHLSALMMMVILLAGCGVTTKKTFLGEPVQKTVGNAVPVSSDAGQTSSDELSRNPALDSAEATGVQKLLNIITPYRINIQQGNFVSQEMLARIQPGMTKEQVRFALGTPLLTDLFHSARWDYLFRLQKPNGQITNNRVIIYFEDNRVARIVNDELPEETQYLESIAGPAPKKKADSSDRKAEATQEKETDTSTDRLVPGTTPVADTPEATTEAVEHTSVSSEPDTDTATPVVTDTPETSPSTTETPTDTPVETYRSQPVVTSTPETTPSRTEAVETAPVERETYQPAPVETSRHESRPASTEVTPVATEVEPVRAVTQEPARQEVSRKAATTTQAISDEPEDDFRAAPNSTMQLHELMQPQ